MGYAKVVVEADGGSRGNPGLAGYGTVLLDATTGAVIAERGMRIGVATNNVAEYRGLIAGLELYREYADGAALEVRMDSKLVVEQMSGRWKIKHPDMRPLALEANRLAPAGTTYTWIPREKNSYADRLANEAMDAPEGTVIGGPSSTPLEPPPRADVPMPLWEQGTPTTLVLIRHGATEHTVERRFSGSGGADPELSSLGRAQVAAVAEWLAPLAEKDPVRLSSPMVRTRQSAEIIAEHLGGPFELDSGLLEAGFGHWEGLTYAETRRQDPDGFAAWFGNVEVRPGGHGDSLIEFDQRVSQTRDRLLAAYPGRTIVAVSHLTPIKVLTRQVLDLPLGLLHRTEIAPASVTMLSYYPDGTPVLHLLNFRAAEGPATP